MNFKTHKNLLQKAVNSGCRTMAEFAMYLKAHEAVTGVNR